MPGSLARHASDDDTRPAGRAAARVRHSVRTVKTGEMIAAYLRSRIVRGELAEGDSLPSEVELMRQFDVSRPTLREAFRILETESLIEIRRGARGARIIAPAVDVAARYVGLLLQTSGTTIRDVYEARSMLEPIAAALLARRRTAQDVADLRSCIDELEVLLRAGRPADIAGWIHTSQGFHDLVMQRAGNKTLAIQYLVLREVVDMHLLIASSQPTLAKAPAAIFTRVVRSYRKLLAMVEAGDAAGAEAHWRAHMDVAALSLLPDHLKSATVLDLFSEQAPQAHH